MNWLRLGSCSWARRFSDAWLATAVEAMTQRSAPHHRRVPVGVDLGAAIPNYSDDFVIVASAGVPRRHHQPLTRLDLRGSASGAIMRLAHLLVRDAPL